MITIEGFISQCWLPVVEFYRRSGPYSIRMGGGTPSRLIWNEFDVVLQVAIRAASVYGHEWVHMESPAPKIKIDLVITNPEPFNKKMRTDGETKYDFAAEFKIHNDDGHPNYCFAAIEADAKRVCDLKNKGTIKEGVVCVVVKTADDHEEDYRRLEDQYKIRILRCCDDKAALEDADKGR